MDEPFSALDEFTREVLRHELLRLWESDHKTVVFVTHSVTEAVLLSDEVVVMSAQPGRIAAVVPVELPRPRDEGIELTAEFVDVERTVRAALRGGWRHGTD
jgi:NitT/TauT family transport system ATP-binding protein